MNDFTPWSLYILGCLTPPIVIAIMALVMEGWDRLKAWHKERTIFVAAYARCPHNCGYDCASYISGPLKRKRSVRNMMQEHLEQVHGD